MSTELRLLTGREIRNLLPIAECIDLMEATMIAISQGQALLPLRSIMKMPGDIGALGIMPGYLATADIYAVKLISLFLCNVGTSHSSHLGMLVLFETAHGYPVGLLDAAEITAIRTAAASGMATRLLAREDATRLAILGTGEQARRHVEAMIAVRPITEIRIWGHNLAKAQALAAACAATYGVGCSAAGQVPDAVAGGRRYRLHHDHASEPILSGDWIEPGTHLNIAGSSIPSMTEIDSDLVVRSLFFVDYRASALNQAGEYLRALAADLIGPDHILDEIGEVASGKVAGRHSGDDITIYKSLGVAAQDIAAGHYALARASERYIGQCIPFG